MTRKDFEMLAAAIQSSLLEFADPSEGKDGIRTVANTLAQALRHDNPRFDRDRFLTACGL